MSKFLELLKKRYIRFLFLAASGILTGLTVNFPVLGILEWFSLIPMGLVLISLCDDERNRLISFYGYGFFFFICYFITVWHWFFAMYPMSYTGMSEIAALAVLLAAVIGLTALQSVSFALIFVLFGVIARGQSAKRFKIIAPFAVAALWTVLEWAQTLFWFGVPWGRLAIGQTDILVTIQTASWFGCTFITFLLVAVNMLLSYAITSGDKRRLTVSVAAGIFCANTLAGIIMMTLPARIGETVRVAAIQGNIGTDDKWENGWFDATEKVYSRLTEDAADDDAVIVIWPETVLHVYIETSPRALYLVKSLAKENQIVLIVGTVTYGEDGEDAYNTALTVYPDGSFAKDNYTKQHLVPFGEYVPLREFFTTIIPGLGEINMLESEFAPGHGSTVVDTGNGLVGSAICFDSIYEEALRHSALNGAEFFAIESNDAWFYDSRAGYMHLAQARLRAVENGRYVVRSASTGISAVIDDRGRLISTVPALEEGYIVEDITLINEKTPFTVIGNLFVLISGIALIGVTVTDVIFGITRKEKREND